MTQATPGAPDLAAGPPRRWNAEVDGVIWLPRMIDKARAFDAGTLGMYLYGQSPVDNHVLRLARTDYAGLLTLVRAAPDDRSVLDALERRSPGAKERLLRFSRRPPVALRLFVRMLDLDEGYVKGPGSALTRGALHVLYVPLVATLRTVFPLTP